MTSNCVLPLIGTDTRQFLLSAIVSDWDTGCFQNVRPALKLLNGREAEPPAGPYSWLSRLWRFHIGHQSRLWKVRLRPPADAELKLVLGSAGASPSRLNSHTQRYLYSITNTIAIAIETEAANSIASLLGVY